MSRGYAGRLLDVDLSTENIRDLVLSEETLRKYFGGRGLASWILWDRLGDYWSSVDPLSPQNLLLILTGPLTGFYPGGRICISGKSPQNNGIIGSTVGGEFGVELKCAGYDGLIIKGGARSPVYIFVKDDETEIREATHLWGNDGKQTLRMLTQETRRDLANKRPNYGKWKEPGILYIGPAGEKRVRTASVMTKWTHAAGYGGYGAVMGSMNLKALAVKGTGPLPEVSDLERMKGCLNQISRRLLSQDRMRRWGTGYGGYEVGARRSAEPVRNWQEEWHDEKTLGGDRFDTRFWVKRYWGDFGCPTTCMKLAVIRSGPYSGAIGDGPDYELQAFLGPNLGIFDAESVVYLSALMDDLGLSGINTGAVMSFAAELYQRGTLTEKDLGMTLEWGNTDAFAKLAMNIAKRDGVGDILAEGVYRAALRISDWKGVDVMPYAVHVGGVEVGGHGVRSGLDYTIPISYACSVQGGDHTAVVADAFDDMKRVFSDSAVICFLNIMGMTDPDEVWRFARAVTGWDITLEEWNSELGHRIVHIQRAAFLLGGPDVYWDAQRDDDNPERFYEPLPTGPKAGELVDKETFKTMRKQYYDAIGWDENGIPRADVLNRLGLENVDDALKKLRNSKSGT